MLQIHTWTTVVNSLKLQWKCSCSRGRTSWTDADRCRSRGGIRYLPRGLIMSPPSPDGKRVILSFKWLNWNFSRGKILRYRIPQGSKSPEWTNDTFLNEITSNLFILGQNSPHEATTELFKGTKDVIYIMREQLRRQNEQIDRKNIENSPQGTS